MTDIDSLLAQADWGPANPDPTRAVADALGRDRRLRRRRAALAAASLTGLALVGAIALTQAESGGRDSLIGPASTASTPPSPSERTSATPTASASSAASAPATAELSQTEAMKLVRALAAFAERPSEERLAALPFAPTVRLGLGDNLVTEVSEAELANPRTWVLQAPGGGYAERANPFNVLEILRENPPVNVALGPSPSFCSASRPPGLDRTTHVRGTNDVAADAACLSRVTAHLFVRDGFIIAVTLGLGDP